MNINQMTITELKALAYDTGEILKRASNNLTVINQQIANKLKEKQMEDEVVATPEVADEAVVEETSTEVATDEVGATLDSAPAEEVAEPTAE